MSNDVSEFKDRCFQDIAGTIPANIGDKVSLVLSSCSPEMMKQRSGLIYTADDMPRPFPMPYVRLHETTRWLV